MMTTTMMPPQNWINRYTELLSNHLLAFSSHPFAPATTTERPGRHRYPHHIYENVMQTYIVGHQIGINKHLTVHTPAENILVDTMMCTVNAIKSLVLHLAPHKGAKVCYEYTSIKSKLNTWYSDYNTYNYTENNIVCTRTLLGASHSAPTTQGVFAGVWRAHNICRQPLPIGWYKHLCIHECARKMKNTLFMAYKPNKILNLQAL